MNGAHSLLATLVGSGVDVCFANPGTSEMHFVAALDGVPELRPVLALFEGVATGAADGFARMAGRPAAVLLHLGPGLGNGLANLHNARRAGSGIVTVVGEHATGHQRYDAPLQSDIAAVAGSVSAWLRTSASAADVGRDAADAVAAARAGRIATLVLPADASWSDGGKAADPAPVPGTVTRRDLLPGYAEHLRKLVDISSIRPLTVAVDAGNGMAGHTVPKVFDGLPVTLIPLYFDLDGTFPNHEANPIDPENLRDLQRAVTEHHADIGLAFDGDADRCFVVDERGEPVSPSVITALIATRELAREPGATIIHNLITSRAVPEIVTENGGVPVRTRVGHSFIKAKMAEYGAVFGGEHSGHFYFRDFWFADSGMLAALHTLAALGEQPLPLSQLLARYARYVASGEINSEVADQTASTEQVRRAFAGRPGVSTDELDGLTVSTATWWFNLRPSNTEPLLRLNVEADTEATMVSLRDEVLGMVRG